MGIGDIGHTPLEQGEAPEIAGEECSWRLLDDGLLLPHQTKEVHHLTKILFEGQYAVPPVDPPSPTLPPLHTGAHLLPGKLLDVAFT